MSRRNPGGDASPGYKIEAFSRQIWNTGWGVPVQLAIVPSNGFLIATCRELSLKGFVPVAPQLILEAVVADHAQRERLSEAMIALMKGEKTHVPMVFVCSPLRGDIAGNQARARVYCARVAQEGVVPFAPHLYCTFYLDENVEAERDLGIAHGLEFMRRCAEIRVFGTRVENGQRVGVSSGMAAEIAAATKLGLPITYVSETGILAG